MKERAALAYDWEFWAREKQLPPDWDWEVWLIMAGRGFGKTRPGSEWVRGLAESGQIGRIALVAETAADARDVIVEGESGILAISPPDFKPLYEPSKRRLTWPNGAIATTFSGEDPEQLRGPQFEAALVDELGKYRYAQAVWDNLQFATRLSDNVPIMVTTTPRPIPLIRELVKDARSPQNPQGSVALVTGSTYENQANLSPKFIRKVVRRYEGTRLGRQELHAELLMDTPGALWTRELLEACRESHAPELVKIVVGVDPMAGEPDEENDDPSVEGRLAFGKATGIIAAGLGANGHGYVLEDLTLSGLPSEWGDQVVSAYTKTRANEVVGEINNGGKMVAFVVGVAAQKARVVLPFREVRASQGKYTRAEPVSMFYEQHRVHHVGMFPLLEDEQCTWKPGRPSPNRIDALVWALWALMIEPEENDEEDDSDERYEDVAAMVSPM